MTFETRGYLSEELDEWTKRVRFEEAPTFGLVDSVSHLGQRVIRMIDGKPHTNQNMLACAFYMRALQSLQGAILLTERGMYVEGRSLIRSTLETTFYVVAALNKPEFAERIRQSHLIETKKLFKAHRAVAAKVMGDPDVYAKMEEAFRPAASNEGGEKKLPISEVADLAGLKDMYETFYRGLSNDASHPGLNRPGFAGGCFV
jgi:hypothetical protein